MNNDDKPRCAGEVWPARSFRPSRCTATGKHEHEGKLYCGTHHPPTVAARQAAKDAQRRKEEARRRAIQVAVHAALKAVDLRATPDDDLAAECARRGWVVTRG